MEGGGVEKEVGKEGEKRKRSRQTHCQAPTSLSLSVPSLCVPCGITYLLFPPPLPLCKAIRAPDSDGDYKTTGAASPPKQSVFLLLFFQGLAPPGVP